MAMGYLPLVFISSIKLSPNTGRSSSSCSISSLYSYSLRLCDGIDTLMLPWGRLSSHLFILQSARFLWALWRRIHVLPRQGKKCMFRTPFFKTILPNRNNNQLKTIISLDLPIICFEKALFYPVSGVIQLEEPKQFESWNRII